MTYILCEAFGNEIKRMKNMNRKQKMLFDHCKKYNMHCGYIYIYNTVVLKITNIPL